MNSLRLPLFPLSLVLFPGTTVPLHLFEPRYRQLLKDVEAGDRRFGIICPARVNGENEVPAGQVGCIAEVVDVETLPDEPAQLAWSIAAMIDLDLDARQRLLGERLPSARLATIDGVLRNALPDLELRAAMHKPA